MTSALMSSQSADGFQQMMLSAKAEATSYWISADEAKRERRSDVVLIFSRWFSIDDVIGDVIQSQDSAADEATVHPVATQSIQSQDSAGRCCDGNNQQARRFSSFSSSAKYPVDKETAVARSVVTKNKQQLSEQLLNNQLENIQPLQAINAQDGKNQWLRFNRASCLNSREQDLYYSGKQYNLQRMFARIWKEDKLAISSAEQIWNLSNGHISNRGYIFEKRSLKKCSEE
ncbi:hypothetical protein F511_12426 [Dorcoceras hygrometricum]|uniref:Uncharacterized protein n=1 Tax=Dorcoceras hygrometricum TaxID=472368 RepID=A0A2Z7BZL4_9LAMI|nr:hypothetical protein F511_12426 [Dorcoceras hygrometricum]